MAVKSELLFFFSAMGAFNGVLLSLYFIFFARPKHISNVFLGGFLLSLSIRIGKSVFFYFIPELAMSFRQIGMTGCFFIGPFLYLYFRSVNRSHDAKDKIWRIHLIILTILALAVSIPFPYEGNIHLWENYVIKNIYHIWLAYTVLAGFELVAYLKKVKKEGTKFTQFEIWLLSIYVGNGLIWLSYYFVGWSSYILGALLFSFMFYLLCMLLISMKRKDSLLLKTQASYKNKKITSIVAKEMTARLEHLMKTEMIFKNPNLKLSDVAKRLNILPHTLSQLLNDNMGVGFSKYINQWRVKEAKHVIAREKNLKLDAVGFECGFNSTSTFYTTFKKMEGLTPSKFRDSLL